MNQYPRSELGVVYFHVGPCKARSQFECGCFAVAGLEEDGAA
jgi:hypothetical protein